MEVGTNWQGPGIYEHYKGGHYIAIGLVRLEWNRGVGVAYMTLDPAHQRDNFYENVMFTVRPLNDEDGEDCWNSTVLVDDSLSQFSKPATTPPMVQEADRSVPRFRKIA